MCVPCLHNMLVLLLTIPQSGETCSGFKVGRAQRAVKFRFMKNSGVVAVTCRHVLFRAGAVADMDGGES